MGIYEAIKDGVEVARKADNIEVMKQLLDAQKEALDLFEENRRLRDRIRELEDQQKTRDALNYKGKSYWLQTDKGEQGPYCATCWDVDGKLVRKTKTVYTDSNEADGRQYFCAYCNSGARKKS